MIVTRILLWALVTFHLEQCLAVRHHVMPERNGALISAVSACDRLNKKQCRNYQKRKDVPAGYKCAWMKNCYKGLIFVKGPFKHTADCGILGLRAQGVCIGIVESPMHLASPPSDHDEEVEEGPPTAASDDLDDDALYGIVAGPHWKNFALRDRSFYKGETGNELEDDDVPPKSQPSRSWFSWNSGVPSEDNAQPMKKEELEDEEPPPTDQSANKGWSSWGWGSKSSKSEELEDEEPAPKGQDMSQTQTNDVLDDGELPSEKPSRSWFSWNSGVPSEDNAQPMTKEELEDEPTPTEQSASTGWSWGSQTAQDQDTSDRLDDSELPSEKPSRSWFSWNSGVPSEDNAQPMMKEELEDEPTPTEQSASTGWSWGSQTSQDQDTSDMLDDGERPIDKPSRSWFSWNSGVPSEDNAQPMMKEELEDEPTPTDQSESQGGWGWGSKSSESEEPDESADDDFEDNGIGGGAMDDPNMPMRIEACGRPGPPNYETEQIRRHRKLVTICRDSDYFGGSYPSGGDKREGTRGRFAKKLCCGQWVGSEWQWLQ
eukprot:Skav234038  [mRNA]  locus=scaffold5814:41020:52798:- [translate_table: standard]